MTQEELTSPVKPTWCPGCGNFSIFAALKEAAVKEGWDNTNTVLVAGIGCHGHLLNFIKLNSFEGLHGRAIPVATGIKITNKKLNVIVHTGDGDCLAEGGNHFIHACRRNHDIKVLLHDNALYALTTGQTSPLTQHGVKTKSTPLGNLDEPFFPLALAIASGATFAARAFAGDIEKLTEILIEAVNHKGFSVVDILQPCVSFNKQCTFAFYKENTYYLPKEYDFTNKETAFSKAQEYGVKKIPLGIIYKVEKPTYESQVPQIQKQTLIERGASKKDLNEIFKKYI